MIWEVSDSRLDASARNKYQKLKYIFQVKEFPLTVIIVLTQFILFHFLFKLLVTMLTILIDHILLSFSCGIYLVKVLIIWAILRLIFNWYVCYNLMIVFVNCNILCFEMILIGLIYLLWLWIFVMRISMGLNLNLLPWVLFNLISLSEA